MLVNLNQRVFVLPAPKSVCKQMEKEEQVAVESFPAT